MFLSRRRFLQASGAAVSAMGLGNLVGAQETAADTNDIRVAVIGVRGRGVHHMQNLEENVVALCDADQKVLTVRAKEFSAKTDRKVQVFTDYRELLEQEDIDAVSIATPNHLHSLIAIAACQAGKDVYVEKPVSHNVWEGRQLVTAAQRHGRIVQAGTQARSAKAIQAAVQYVREGNLGPIQYAIGTCYKPRQSIGRLKYPLQIPKHVDYDLWCGPAAKTQIYRPSLHYDWHWDFNTGNGDMGNQGIHQTDIARWFLGERTLAPRVVSVGGRLGYDDAGDTPNTQTVLHDYAKAPLIFETRGLPKSKDSWEDWEESMDRFRGSQIGVIVQCEDGYIVAPSNYSVVTVFDNDDQEVKRWENDPGNHYDNWMLAVASRDASQLNGQIEEGHISSALCHVGQVSHQLGQRATVSEINATLKEQSAGELFVDSVERMIDHLGKNGVDLTTSKLVAGQWLELDVENERFRENDEANELLTRDDRKPFIVPDLSAELATAAT